ncbi:DUF1657 domain-containing protein [Schinkia azotoformans]|uniref:DUF1657 domain-containing protein n=1 Tax=Schinkia azotoformans TaxID=1454 RepID=UPI002DBED943|nr:DUF1657 domain-containing protein [Schinkia azotoformans]MEC1739381.1 DUF1657 domain-containing protein [Schinkia azotoformans]MEC1765879.1 DUF1657 domain-containing protein [Schinkia azotoformans]MEC1785874.1 DUF1657 domain-containing protein [Schinkia azotoformans]MED4377165.1 DUF1657 domain-containing protein [Schinkia azotoformans]MED4418105.1 DUF1657 domain-containing protein [Schinkia azotoformans]
MTVGTQVKQALVSLKSAQADFESFALQTQDQAAKQLYANCATQAKGMIQQLEQRVQHIEEEEPEFQGF